MRKCQATDAANLTVYTRKVQLVYTGRKAAAGYI